MSNKQFLTLVIVKQTKNNLTLVKNACKMENKQYFFFVLNAEKNFCAHYFRYIMISNVNDLKNN